MNRRTYVVTLAVLVLLAGVVAIAKAPAQEPEKSTARESGTRSGNRVPNRPTESREPTSSISRLAVPPARNVVFTEEREAAARVFAQKYRPEMVAVLDQLKTGKPSEYQQVICDLFRSSESFAALRQQDRERGDLALKTWQVEAKTHLLAAELASHGTRSVPATLDESERIRLELRQEIEKLADLQIEKAALEVRQAQAKLRRAEGVRTKLENRKSEFVSERVEAILQAIGKLEPGRGAVPETKTDID